MTLLGNVRERGHTLDVSDGAYAGAVAALAASGRAERASQIMTDIRRAGGRISEWPRLWEALRRMGVAETVSSGGDSLLLDA